METEAITVGVCDQAEDTALFFLPWKARSPSPHRPRTQREAEFGWGAETATKQFVGMTELLWWSGDGKNPFDSAKPQSRTRCFSNAFLNYELQQRGEFLHPVLKAFVPSRAFAPWG